MSISDLLLPKWKHSNPEVRREAVLKMDGSSDEETLATIIQTDTDQGVRLAAIEKTPRTELLETLLRNDSDVTIQQAVIKRLKPVYLERIQQAESFESQKSMLGDIDQADILTFIACEIDMPEVRLAIIDKLEEADLLCQIAENNCGLKPGKRIIEKLDDITWLERIAANSSNKKVRRIAKEKIDQKLNTMNRATPEAQKEIALKALCERLATLYREKKHDAYVAVAAEVKRAWQDLDPEHTHALYPQMTNLLQKIETEWQTEKNIRNTTAALETLCEEAARLLDPFSVDPGKLEKVQSHWETLEKSILPQEIRAPLENKFERTCEAYRQKHQAFIRDQERNQEKVERLTELCVQMEGLVAEGAPPSVIKTCDSLENDWQREFIATETTHPLQKRFETAKANFRQNIEKEKALLEQQQKDQENALIGLCERVETACADDNPLQHDADVKAAQQEWRECRLNDKERQNALTERFQEACSLFFERVAEKRSHLDWERWANLNQKKALCEQVEALAPEDAMNGVVKKVRDLQKQWKEIGPVSKADSEEIWERFKCACDRILLPCLEMKKSLLDRVAAATAVETDNFQKITENVKALQEEWKLIGPLPLSLEKEIRESFQKICDDFFEARREHFQKLDEERHQNLILKEALCEEAESIKDSMDFKKTSMKLKDLQARWKQIGPVPKSKSEALWGRFHSACNYFFQNLEKVKPDNLAQKEALCLELETLTNPIDEQADLTKVRRQIIDIQKKWKAIGPVPREMENVIWDRFKGVCDAFFDTHKEHFSALQEQQKTNQNQKEAMVKEALELSVSTDWKNARERLIELQAEWKTVGPGQRQTDQTLWQQFHDACNVFFERSKQHYEAMDHQRVENLRRKRELCLQIELLAKVTLEKPEIEYDPDTPMAEQLTIALDFKNELFVAGDPKITRENAFRKLKQIQAQWKQIGPVPSKEDDVIWSRYRKAFNYFNKA